MLADHLHTDHAVTFKFEPHAGHTTRSPAHRTDLFVVLVEEAGHAEPGRKQDFVAVLADAGADEIIVVLDDEGAQTDPAEVLEEGQLALLDVAPARGMTMYLFGSLNSSWLTVSIAQIFSPGSILIMLTIALPLPVRDPSGIS